MNSREKLLESAYNEIYLKGYNSASLSDIIRNSGLTKGALYYYFKNKKDLGFAVIEEYIKKPLETSFILPLNNSKTPINTLISIIKDIKNNLNKKQLRLGCPLNNLAIELMPVDKYFNKLIKNIYKAWIESIKKCLIISEKKGIIELKDSAYNTACFIIASLSGIKGLGKIYNDTKTIKAGLENLIMFIEGLKKTKRRSQ